MLLGAATWFVFATVLESIPKAILFNPLLPVGKAVLGDAALFTVSGALLAGIFEETGRWLAFRTVLKKRTNKETAVSHGIGHGGFEVFFLLVVSGVQYLVFAVLINTGTFEAIIEKTAQQGVDVSALQALPQQLMAITPANACLSMAERIFAMLLHLGLSVLVFYAVRKSKPGMYILAILLHALFDVPPALYQFGILSDIFAVEGFLAAYSAIFFVLVFFLLYKKDKDTVPEQPDTE